MTSHLVIPDVHAKQGMDFSALRALGNLIVERRPDVIVCLGDFADMESLCSYDKGRRSFEGRRYTIDIRAAHLAQETLFTPLAILQNRQHNNRKKVYNPSTVILVGNHEQRIERATQLDPVLHGTISIDDLEYNEFWHEVVPFLEIKNIDGINYSHYFTSGVMGRPVSGEHPAASLLAKHHASCTAGHLHVADYAQRTTAEGKKIHGLVAGCFTEQEEDYAGPANALWWRGVVYKHNVNNGDYDPEFISIQRLKEEYGRDN